MPPRDLPPSRDFIGSSPTLSDPADAFANTVAATLASGGVGAMAQYDSFPGPVYAIAVSGHLMYCNEACLAITGRTPQIGIDLWCVAAAVLTLDGSAVDFASGPMAAAVRDGLPVRSLEALVERPDGERVAVRSFPTPAIDDQGTMIGAINLLVPLDAVIRDQLLDTAHRCKTLGKWISDHAASNALNAMASECERHAEVLNPG